MAEQPFNWRPTLRRRVLVAGAILALWTIGIEARLVYLQIVAHDDLAARAERQQLRTLEVPAKRGEIYDREGRMLAYSVDADTVYAVPVEISDVKKTAAALCSALEDCDARERKALEERLGRQRAFVYVKRRITPAEARAVAALNLEGIGFMRESRRFYPNRELAAHLLGYVGTDNVGLAGIEAAYDKVIRGREGKVLVQTDARRRAFSRLERTPTSGGSLELTIDEQLQYIVERELLIGVRETNADAGTAVMLDARTGEILAMANWPTFNPNDYNDYDELARRNRAVQDIYEPGSTFKVVTMSAALEEHLIPVNAIIDTSPGSIRFGSRVIDEYAGHNYGPLSFTDVIVKSSNVGAIKIGLKVGAERLGVYINRFGFGRPISPDFPGESPGIVWNPAKLNDSALASVSMGYQVGVTPLQVAAAVNSIANGGTWIEPRVVRAIVNDGVRTKVEPTTVRRAVSPETVAKVLPIMEAVVHSDYGTGKAAQIPGYTVAGKTGTADKLVNGRYSPTQQNVSFVGFVPSRDPAFTLIVMLDSPRNGRAAGGRMAAPVFRRIAEAALRYLGVPPNINPQPPVVVARRDANPITPAAATMSKPTIIPLAHASSEYSLFPDLRGLSARDALRTLAQLGVTVELEGTGVVIEQTPPPGAPLERGMHATLVLERSVPRHAEGEKVQP
ncbi:MAG TPA: penicillin-binding protein [Gemmatimonadaceae bacterium]|nr:penicillin-binding protein [Gemmatimonadaceae bacterium]